MFIEISRGLSGADVVSKAEKAALFELETDSTKISWQSINLAFSPNV